MLLVTEPRSGPRRAPGIGRGGLAEHGLDVTTYDQTHVEPTDESLTHAVEYARAEGPFDAVIAVGGGFVDRHGQAVPSS